MTFNYTLPLRAAQALFTIITLGLIGYVVHRTTGWDAANFLLFTAIWTILALLYLVFAPGFIPAAAHKFAVLAVEFLTMLFWFAGFVAVAADLPDNCYSVGWCKTAKAAAAFGAFTWLTFLATTVMAALHVWRTRGTHDTKPDPNSTIHNGV